MGSMKRAMKLLCVAGVVAAFVLMATAMVLPHSHNAETTTAHACWICQSKVVGVSAPETTPRPGVLHLISFAAPAVRRVFEAQASFLFSDARAPPQL